MNLWQAFVQAGQAASQMAYEHQRKNGGAPRRRKGPECTPCAAAAYVESLRGTPPPKKSKKR